MLLWYSVVGWFFAAVAVVGNGLVIFLITAKQRLHTTANWFTLSLAVADFCSGVLFFPSYLVCNVEELCANREGEVLQPIMTFFLVASAINICTMTVDRYIAIVKPLKYISVVTITRVTVVLAVAWICPILASIAIMVVNRSITRIDSTRFEGFLIATMLLTCLVLIIATVHIVYITWKHSRQLAIVVAQLNFNQPQAAPVITVRRSTRESYSAKLIAVVVSLYVLCTVFSIVVFSFAMSNPCSHWIPLNYCKVLLRTVCSALNPVAYSLLKKDINIELLRSVKRSVQPNRVF